jgi:broad specificity phosphatase PhoE
MPTILELVALIIITLHMIDTSSCFTTDPDVVRPANDPVEVVSEPGPPPGGVVIDDDDDDNATTCTADAAPATVTPILAPFLVRLHLIRHGETHANANGLVLGQSDSPLTDNGLSDARLASASVAVNGRGAAPYFRSYCSDLGRAHTTARIVLGMNDENDEEIGIRDDDDRDDRGIRLIPDARLREVAKGAREGYSKGYTIQEAIAMRRRNARDGAIRTPSPSSSSHRHIGAGGGSSSSSNYNVDVDDDDVPKLESAEDAWGRAKNWIDEVVNLARDDYYSDIEMRKRGNGGEDVVTSRRGSDNDNDDHEDDPRVYDIFALSHSALIRNMIQRMVGSELPSEYAKTREGSLDIPNLSRTIIDVRPHHCDGDTHHRSSLSSGNSEMSTRRTTGWTCSLRRLADVSHLHDSSSREPPYS